MKTVFYYLLSSYSLKADDIGLPSATQDIGDAITRTVGLLIELIGALSIIFIIVGAIQITTAAGSPARFKQGRETVLYACIGVALAIASFAIVAFISDRL